MDYLNSLIDNTNGWLDAALHKRSTKKINK